MSAGSTFAAIVLTLLIPPLRVWNPSLLLTVAVLISTWYSGIGGGVLSCVVGIVGSDFYLMDPELQFRLNRAENWQQFTRWLVMVVISGWLMYILRSRETALSAELIRRKELDERLRQDMVERERANEALRQSEERYRRLVELSPEGIAIHDGERFLFANPAALNLLGATSLDELLGRSIWDIFHPDMRAAARARAQRLFAEGGQTPMAEQKLIRLDGSVVSIEVAGNCMSYEGHPAIQIVLRDITIRKQAEEQLDWILSSAQCLLWYGEVTDRGGQMEWKIEMHDDAAAQRFLPLDVPEDELWSEAWYYSKPAEDHERMTVVSEEALRSGKDRYSQEFRCRRRDGAIRWLWEDVYVQPTGPERWRLVGVCTDITDQKEALRAMNATLERRVIERTAELEATNRDLEASAYAIAHDLRGPLRGINGFVGALVEEYGSALDEQAHYYLDRVRSGTVHLAQVMDELLLLVRVTRAPVERRPVSLSAVAEQVVNNLRRSEPERRVEVSIEPDLQAVGDSRLLEVLLQNLIENAWKFTRSEPAARIRFARDPGFRVPTWYVRDNGVGFDMQFAAHLFQPFERLHSSAEFDGTGIGLATVYRIAQRHGGQAWAESAPGEGASFYFSLPAP